MAEKLKDHAKQHGVEFIQYMLVSALALLVDYGCYWLLATYHVLELPQAAVAGYLAGIGVAYFLIAGRVFKNGWLKDQRLYEALLFATSGLLGVASTYLTVLLYVMTFGAQVNGSKMVAITISFISVYLFRKLVVFKQCRLSAR